MIACASGVWICRMSHCSGESGSLSLAGAFWRSPGGGPDASVFSFGSSLVANAEVDAAFSTDVSAASRLLRNDALEDVAIATPISS